MTKSYRAKARDSWHTTFLLSLAGEEFFQKFASFRCRLRGCMEEIQERVTQRPHFGQH
jgi:hypothetical protein